ncbi:hypothetical protein GCM10009840_17840 [Pseudolysinimonas kribbensis]|uniref:HK97 gp10 family phage protein n=1 Tax=Pseudolysinimonas kribbensis TaxID=433641 RepID=A0ABQ6K321_9MICO|nr:hypothetical protein [Pseudolysinimonas kribbensis]GMA93834.1 hypothetical protein GCM10025881_06580 [Pseudolysinimonas kribbensis]
MTDSVTYVSGGVRVRVEGLRTTVSRLNKAGADADDMKDLMHGIGELVVHAAHVPDRSGALAGTVRAGRGKTKAVVRAGGAKAPYAGVIHYGWPARNIAPHPFLTDALSREHEQIFDALERGIDALLAKNSLS